MNIIYFDGQYVSDQDPILSAGDRSFRYGDGVFESMAHYQGKIPLLKKHISRFNDALQVIGIEKRIEESEIRDIVAYLSSKNNIDRNLVVNLIANRKGEGLYTPESDDAYLIVNIKSIEHDNFRLNTVGKTMGTYSDNRKSFGTVSKYKTASALLYVLAGKFCKDSGIDDCIILNSKGQVAEAYSSNIFIYNSGKLFTPSLDSACVSGMMRSEISSLCSDLDIKLVEARLEIDDLKNSEELFTTNAVRGVQWVARYEEVKYKNGIAKLLSDSLNKKWGL